MYCALYVAKTYGARHDAVKILYVEDCEPTIELFQFYLKKYCAVEGLTLEVAGTVADAIRIFSVEKHDAVLIDWNLPDGEGLGVARHIRNIDMSLPIVFLSSVFTEDQIAQARQYQPKACLVKYIGQEYIDTLLGHLQM